MENQQKSKTELRIMLDRMMLKCYDEKKNLLLDKYEIFNEIVYESINYEEIQDNLTFNSDSL